MRGWLGVSLCMIYAWLTFRQHVRCMWSCGCVWSVDDINKFDHRHWRGSQQLCLLTSVQLFHPHRILSRILLLCLVYFPRSSKLSTHFRVSESRNKHMSNLPLKLLRTLRFFNKSNYEYKIFSLLSSTRAWTNIIFGGKKQWPSSFYWEFQQ